MSWLSRISFGYWLLVIGYWLLVIGYWLLVIESKRSGFAVAQAIPQALS